MSSGWVHASRQRPHAPLVSPVTSTVASTPSSTVSSRISKSSGAPSGTLMRGTFRSAGAATVFCSLRIAPAPRPRSLVSSTSSERVSVTANSNEDEERFFWQVSLVSDLISLLLSGPACKFTRWSHFDPNVQPFPAGPGPFAPLGGRDRPGFASPVPLRRSQPQPAGDHTSHRWIALFYAPPL